MGEGLRNKRLIIGEEKFKKIVDISSESVVNLPSGSITVEKLRELPAGQVFTVNNKRYYMFDCDLYNYIMHKLKRKTQIVYPKDAGYILIRLDVSPGKRIGEAGTGSGALTALFSRMVGGEGRVYTYEQREDFLETIRKNLSGCQEFDNVIVHNKALQDGIEEKDLDAFFLDVREPWEVLDNVWEALRPGGYVGIIVPTANQVSRTLEYLNGARFYVSEITEIMIRNYKQNSERLRPRDVMVGHTGYLIFGRKYIL